MVNEENYSKKDSEPSKTNKNECVNCASFRRKVCEAEKTVSARDVLIQMLQKEVKKIENLYKNSIDDYENLRFDHCTTLHQLSNLRAIHKKLKEDHLKLTIERDSTKNHLNTLQNETEKCKNQKKTVENQIDLTESKSDVITVKPPNCPQKQIIKEVINIESNIQNQNRRLKNLMCKLLDEAQDNCSTEIEEIINNEISKSKSGRELINIIEELSKQIDNLNNFVVTLKSENDSIKYQLTEKISNLSSCLNDLEKNHCNINNLSETIENIISEKENYIQEIKNLKNVIEANNKELQKREEDISELKCQCYCISEEAEKLQDERLQMQEHLDECMQHVAELQREYSEKEETWNTSKNKLMDDIKQIEDTNKDLNDMLVNLTNENKSNLERIASLERNNKELNDMLVDLTNENKSNLEKITSLNRNLIETSKEFEECECVLKQKNLELVVEMEEYKVKQQEKEKEAESKSLKSDDTINKLNSKIKLLEKDLEELTLENNEYEEENKYYCQQLDGLISQLHELEKEKIKAEDDNEHCCRIIDELKRSYEQLDSQKKSELKELKEEINEVKKSQEYLYNSEKDDDETKNTIALMEEELNEVKSLKAKIENENDNLKSQITKLQMQLHDFEKNNDDYKNSNSSMGEELKQFKSLAAKTEHENDNLRSQINNLKKELNEIHYSTESQILNLQEKFNELEKQQTERSKQICSCSDQLQCIKKISDEQKLENQKYLITLQELEKQKALLEEEQIKLDNESQQNLEEIKDLKNRVQECKETAIKNENDMKDIKSINDKLHEEIETMNIEYCREEHLISHLEQCIENSNHMLEECEKELKQLHIENENLEKENDVLKATLEKYLCDVIEHEAQKHNVDEILKQKQPIDLEIVERVKWKDETTNTHTTNKQLNKILEDNKQKEEELEDLRRQLEFIQKSSEIYKSEYEKLKKAYTEIKASLAERMQKYNAETQSLNYENIDIQICCETEMMKSRLSSEKQIQEMESAITEKEMTIKHLHHCLNQSACEICQLKTYVNKLITDNKNLKQAIENLLSTLVAKFKAFSESGDDVEESSSVRMMMQDILDSLMHLEKHISRDSNCSLERCNCMSVISSQYKPDNVKTSAQRVEGYNSVCKKAITVLKKCDNMNVESSSEIIGICSDCCQEHGDCDNSSSHVSEAENEDKHPDELLELEYKPEQVKSDEPFTIEPDSSE